MQTTQVKYDTARAELAQYRQWLAWQYSEDGREKRPISPHTFRYTSATHCICGYEDALFVSGGMTDRLGFVLTANDPFCVVDLDNCIIEGEVQPWALEIVEALNSYTELSPSGTGLHIWTTGTKPDGITKKKRKYETGTVEIFYKSFFVTFTARQFGSNSRIEERQEELEALYNLLFTVTSESNRINTGGVADGGFPGDDEKLLDKARNANGTGKLFTILYDLGNWHGKFPSQSEADLRLGGMLAFWTRCDEERMDRLFRGSALARTLDRKPNPDDYLERTISEAIENCDNVYDPQTYKAKIEADVRKVLEGCIEYVLYGDWSGRSGGTDRDVYKVLINTGLMRGKLTADGVIVSASVRSIASESGIGRRATVIDALRRLERNRELIEKLEDGSSKKAATYLIKSARTRTIKNCVNSYGTPLRATRRIRNPSHYYSTIGKRRAQIVDYVHAQDSAVNLDEIARLLGARARDVRTRYIPLLLDLGLLEEVDGAYVTPADIEARLERFLEDSGMAQAERLQVERYERERQVWRSPRPTKTVSIPSPPVNEVLAVGRSCYLDADGIAQHIDPLCDDDCSVSFGHTHRVKETAA